MLSWGGIEWIDSYRQSGLLNDLRDTIKWGTDWIIKAHPEPNVLFVQVSFFKKKIVLPLFSKKSNLFFCR